MGPVKQKLNIPLLCCVGIILSMVCCIPSGAAADSIALTSQNQLATSAVADSANLAYLKGWADIYGEASRDIGFRPADTTLTLHSFVDYGPAYVSLLTGSTSLSAKPSFSSDVGTTTTRPATASEGSTLILLTISALSIGLILLRNRRCGTNRSQDAYLSADSAREDHLTNSYETYSPHGAPENELSAASLQGSINPGETCSRT